MSAILDLSGSWQMIFDTSNDGLDQRWYANPPEELQTVNIPHTWEEDFGKYPGSIAFYFKDFYLDESVNAKRALIRIQRSFFYTQMWINGKLVSEEIGGHHSFDINVSKAVKPGEVNSICLRVASEAASRINGTHISELPVGLPFYAKSFGGLWGGVQFISGGKASILSCNVTPDQDTPKFAVELEMCNPRNFNAKFLFILTRPDGKSSEFTKEVKLEKEDASYNLSFQLKECDLWSPEEPNLYKLEVYLDKSYGVTKLFGFRKFDILRSEYYLNDKTFRLQGVVYNLSHPQTGSFESDPKKIRKDLEHLKATGFNILRSGGAPLDDIALDICDEIGLMVWQEMPMHNMKSSKEGLELSKKIIESIIKQQKTHPSVVAWVLGSENGTLMLENGTKLLKYTDEFDSNRPVLSNLNSVYIDNEGTFKNDTGKVMGVTNDKILPFNSHRINPSMNLSSELSNFFANYFTEGSTSAEVDDVTLGGPEFAKGYDTLNSQNSSGRVLVNLSNHSMIPDFKDTLKAYGKHKSEANGKRLNQMSKDFHQFLEEDLPSHLWKSAEEFQEAANQVALKATFDRVNAFLSSPHVNGYFLDCWADANILFNGIVDEFRNSKGAEDLVNKMNRPTRLMVSGLDRTPDAGTEMQFNLRLLNGARIGSFEIKAEILDQAGKAASKAKLSDEAIGSVFAIEGLKIKAPKKEGSYTLKLTLHQGKTELYVHEDALYIPETIKVDSLESSFINLDRHLDDIDKSKVLFSSHLDHWDEGVFEDVNSAVTGGATLILSHLKPQDLKALQSHELLPKKLRVENATGAKTSCFHYWLPSGYFKQFPEQYLCDSVFADVAPDYSFSGHSLDNILAGSIGFQEDGELQTLEDIAEFKLGKGKVLIHQYHLGKYRSNALARLLLKNTLEEI